MKYSYVVYFDQGHAVLEVQRKEGLYSIYFVDEEGGSEFVGNLDVPYAPVNKLPADEYFIDRVQGPTLRTIDILTKKTNYDDLIGRVRFLDSVVEPGKYSFLDFNMDLSYIMIDLVDAIKQNALLLEDQSYEKQAEDTYAFFDRHFFGRDRELSPDDFKEVKNFLSTQIKLLESFKSQ